jgi:HD-GYP domain-containing protein (c-di-GMP phosphodiesterase class II)
MTKLGPLSIAVGHYTKMTAAENIRLCITKADENMYANKNQMKRRFYEDIFNYLSRKMIGHLYEGNHVISRVREFMAEMCLLDAETKGLVKEAVLLSDVYDIGMICLDQDLYTTKILDDDERKSVKRHCETGAKIADMSPVHLKISKYILYHHHRFDGRGSTDGVKGDQIPVLSRMLAVVDSYVAITGKRVYRDPMNVKQAVNEIAKGAGNQFDPWAVDLFLKALKKMDISG